MEFSGKFTGAGTSAGADAVAAMGSDDPAIRTMILKRGFIAFCGDFC